MPEFRNTGSSSGLYRLLFAGLALFAVADALAHGDGTPPVYVSARGVDAGQCRDSAMPCGTIGYAVQWAGKGGQVRVAAGSYEVDDAGTLFQLLSNDIDIRGGYGREDGFSAPTSNPSILVGVPVAYADELSKRGFHVVVDRKGFDRELAAETESLLAIHDRLKSSLNATPCTGGSISGMPCSNVDLLSHVGLADVSTSPGTAADVWGFVDLNSNREYVIVGFRTGTGVFDVTDPENPREVGFIDGQSTTWRDIKVYQYWNAAESRWNAQAYVTTDGASDGLFVIDLSQLPQRIRQRNYPSEFSAAHNVYLTNTDFGTGIALDRSEPTLVIAGSNIANGPYRSYAVSNPASPSFIAMPGSGRSDYMHDAASMVITDSRKDTQCVNATSYCEVLFDFNETTFDIWDITAPAIPQRLSRTSYANVSYVHSGWWSEDRQFLFVHDELDEQSYGLNTTLRVFSLADLRLPVAAGNWVGPARAIDHNGFVRGNRYYMSNYSEGLTILDITDPGAPVRVGFLDTYPGSSGANFVGAWGAYPFLHSGSIAVSDIGSGLYLVRDRSLEVPQGSLELSAGAYGGAEGETLQVTVQRTGGASGAVGVGYEIVPATGDGGDIQAAGGMLAWADGDSTDRVIPVDLLVDGNAEGLERLLLRLVAPTGGATLGPARVASLYVGDSGSGAVVGFDRAAILTEERGFATAVAVLERSGSARGAASVDFAITSGNADAGADFSGPASGTIDWADGDADPKWIEYDIVDDGAGEGAEFIELTLSNPSGASIGGTGVLRIDIADGNGSSSAPNAVAGASQRVASGATVTLDGSQSNDPDGDALSYQWIQVSGPVVGLSGADTAVASFTAPTVTSDTLMQFELAVTDPIGLSNTAVTTVTVRKPGGSGGGGGGGMLGPSVLLVLLVAAGLRRARRPTRTGGGG